MHQGRIGTIANALYHRVAQKLGEKWERESDMAVNEKMTWAIAWHTKAENDGISLNKY